MRSDENLSTCSWKLEYVAIIKASYWSAIFSDRMADRPDLNAEELGRVVANAVTSFLRPSQSRSGEIERRNETRNRITAALRDYSTIQVSDLYRLNNIYSQCNVFV